MASLDNCCKTNVTNEYVVVASVFNFQSLLVVASEKIMPNTEIKFQACTIHLFSCERSRFSLAYGQVLIHSHLFYLFTCADSIYTPPKVLEK